jgi:lycopene cyclase domain-containing protein
VAHLSYLAVLAGCLAAAGWLEPVLRVRVVARWRRLLLSIVPVAIVFALWDVAALRAGQWRVDRRQSLGVLLPGRLPLEELLFFLVVPLCSILGYEAVRTVRERRRR